MKNAVTFDIEDYFQVTAFRSRLSPAEWDTRESRVQRNTEKILELLASRGCRGTFFILGWVAERYPQVVRSIANQGHEVGCHSHRHGLVYEMTPAEFREDTRRAKSSIEDASGQPVCGYRAPSFSITRSSLWAFEILVELGFAYDSSVFPVEHISYGVPDAPRFPFVVSTRSGSLVEFPMPTVEFAGKRSPIAGGAYLRLLPYRYTHWAIRYLNEEENRPATVYMHPWELDPEQPRLGVGILARLRHYVGLRSVERKLHRLLCDFEFCPMGVLVSEIARDAGAAVWTT